MYRSSITTSSPRFALLSSMIRGALVGLALVGAAKAGNLVIYDDSSATQWRKLERVTEQADAARSGKFGLVVQPDQWHQPLMVLKSGRMDLRTYDRLEMDIRSPSGSINPTLTLWDYALGTTRSLAAYTEGGVIDATWRRVSIPLADLASPAFPLDSVFTFMFGSMAVPKSFHIDNLVLRRLTGASVTGQAVRSSRALTLMTDGFDHAVSNNPAAYTITSATDTAYAIPVQPLAVGSDRQAVGITGGGLGAVVASPLAAADRATTGPQLSGDPGGDGARRQPCQAKCGHGGLGRAAAE